jgi:hypothetical protein
VTDLPALLQEFYQDKLAMMLAHQAGARLVGQYDVNNTYQYIINREEAQLSWIANAILELGGRVPQATEPNRRPTGRGAGADVARHILEEDGHEAQAFVDRWRPRLATLRNARHEKMLALVLGEVLEAKRFFGQALAGRTDLLGRRAEQLGPSHGEVLPSRWIE